MDRATGRERVIENASRPYQIIIYISFFLHKYQARNPVFIGKLGRRVAQNLVSSRGLSRYLFTPMVCVVVLSLIVQEDEPMPKFYKSATLVV